VKCKTSPSPFDAPHVIANWPPVYIGKESDKHWEEGEDLSLLEFKAIQYRTSTARSQAACKLFSYQGMTHLQQIT
jgi:hypothetical protein